MFLTMLNDEQKRAFSVLAHRLAAADGKISREEGEALRNMKAELGVADSGLDDRDESDLAAVFNDQRSRVVALLELLGVAHSDHEFQLDERSMVTVVAHEMGFAATDLERFDNWVRGYAAHVEAALAMMAE